MRAACAGCYRVAQAERFWLIEGMKKTFPKGFVWGAAAASYQIEGAVNEDGRGQTIWDMMCRKPGAIWGGQSGAIACDHYHRYREDVALMKLLGLQAYRLSIAWSRILPEGTGAVNPKGVAFYDRLVDALMAAKIQPFVTLFHWDMPLALYYRGGWLNRDCIGWFADYARVVVDRLSDRVQHWITLNEPACFVVQGHLDGRHAPGDKLAWAEVLRIGHNALCAHGRAVQAIRAHAKRPPQVGYAPFGSVCMPASSRAADVRVAREEMFAIRTRSVWSHSWWNDPIFFGRYPADGLKFFGDDAPRLEPDDLRDIQQPLDFFGVNIYSGRYVRAGKDGQPEFVPPPPGQAQSALHWPVTPEALYWGPRFLYERYRLPIYITENGFSNCDWVSLDGKVHDPQRMDFTQRYLRELHRAICDGVDVRGYFHWSIMDNFEWAEGYKERFGLVYVDYATQRRIPKDSAYWYRKIIRTNGAALW